jgi:hypothetical protein
MEGLSALYASLCNGIVRSRMGPLRAVFHHKFLMPTSLQPNDLLMSPALPYQEAQFELHGLKLSMDIVAKLDSSCFNHHSGTYVPIIC